MAGTNRYRYVTAALDRVGEVESADLATYTERHKARLNPVIVNMAISPSETEGGFAGIVIEMSGGIPGHSVLRVLRVWLRAGKRGFLYWPAEAAVEVADRERLRSLWHLWLAKVAFRGALPLLRRLRTLQLWLDHVPPGPLQASTITLANWERVATLGLDELMRGPRPAPLTAVVNEQGHWRVRGTGAYLRTQFWARITSGGSRCESRLSRSVDSRCRNQGNRP